MKLSTHEMGISGLKQKFHLWLAAWLYTHSDWNNKQSKITIND